MSDFSISFNSFIISFVWNYISGSKKNRKVSFSVNSVNRHDIRSLKLALTSPGKRMEAEATMMNSETEKSVMAKFTDSEVEYLAKLGVAISGNSAKQIYKPLLQYKLPESKEPVISAEGKNENTYEHIYII